jgi:hypothetical protein
MDAPPVANLSPEAATNGADPGLHGGQR